MLEAVLHHHLQSQGGEVVVTDRDGNRVIGLAPQDFRLFVDGEEVYVLGVTIGRGF